MRCFNLFDKLHTYYSESLLFNELPDFSFYSNYHWFKDKNNTKWLGIPFEILDKHELSLLKALFAYETFTLSNKPKKKKWYDFLFLNGEVPIASNNSIFRMILFQFHGTTWETNELEEAIFGFFSEDSIILWEVQNYGVIIEPNPEIKSSEELFLSLSQMLESDFFIKSYFYCGKPQPLSKNWPEHLKADKYFFQQAIRLLPSQPLHTFEKCFPSMLSNQLPLKIQEWLYSQLLEKVADEPDLLTTVKLFLENNSNATLTAKQLYVHRNTLQYRLDKFTVKTGINLKDFHSSLTIYLACLLSEVRRP